MYDSLNDDDDEVRDTGAAAAKHILGQAAVPIEAANRLLEFFATNFKNSLQFREIVVSRLVAAAPEQWTSAADQIEDALQKEDALFAVEEQNLFIDEIRETKRWVSVLESLTVDVSDSSLLKLDDWLLEGLEALQRLCKQDDGPLGWSSNPQVFATASSVLRCSVSLVSSHRASTQLQVKLRNLKEVLDANKDGNISGLLVQPLTDLRLD